MNLTILGLGLAVMGVSIGEGILVANIAVMSQTVGFSTISTKLSEKLLKTLTSLNSVWLDTSFTTLSGMSLRTGMLS